MKFITSRGLAAGLLLLLVTGFDAHGRVLELEDSLDMIRVSSPQISPDGQKIIYVRRHVDRMKDQWVPQFWIADSDGRENRHFGDGANLQWAPGSDRVAYTQGQNGQTAIIVQSVANGGTETITTIPYRVRNLQWSPDGRQIAFTATVPMQDPWPLTLPGRPQGAEWTADPMIVDRLHYRIDGEGIKSGFDHIFVVDASGGAPRQLTSGEWDVGARAAGLNTRSRLEWGPDGRTLFFDGYDGEDSLGMSSHVYRIDTRTLEMTRLTRTDGFWSSPRVSPDGRELAYVGYEGTTPDQPTYPGYQIRRMNIDGSNDRVIHDSWQGRIYTQVAAVADFLDWRSDGRGLYVTGYSEGATNVVLLSLDGTIRPATERDYGFDISTVSDDGLAAGTIASPHVPGNIATASLADGRIRPVTDANAALLRDIELGEVEEMWYESESGVRIQGWIVKPPNFDQDRQYPLVLSIHGGPHAMYEPTFDFTFQDFAARGYVVLFTNPRGSLGYGVDFANAINDSITGAEALNDLMAGVDALLERGYVDEQRMNVTGCSGGGLLTNWIVTQTDRFRAAAARCSIANWVSFAGTADIVIGVHHFFDKRYWEDPTSWREHSAINYVANVTTPTLLMTGARDFRTPLSQAEEFYAALKMRGVPAKLISMTDEYHGTGRIPSNFLRTQLYLQQWFAAHGGGPAEN